MSIVAGNGIFWPYAVIWASSQARKETISFLRKIHLSIVTCNFKNDSQSGLPQRVQAIKDWKDNERRSKASGKGINENIFDDNEKNTRSRKKKSNRLSDFSISSERPQTVQNVQTKNFSYDKLDYNPNSIPRADSCSFLQTETSDKRDSIVLDDSKKDLKSWDSGKKSQDCDNLTSNHLTTTSSDLSCIINQYSSLLYNQRFAYPKNSDSSPQYNFNEENETDALNPGLNNKRKLDNENASNDNNNSPIENYKQSTDGLLLECLEDIEGAIPTLNVKNDDSLAEMMEDCCDVECKPESSKFLKASGLSPIANNDSNTKRVKDETNEENYKQRTKIVNHCILKERFILVFSLTLD